MTENYELQTNQEETKKTKSRHLSIFDFYKILQLECIASDLRSKFYPKIQDKEYWKKVYINKKTTVEDISSRNKVNNQPLPSIFTDDEILQTYRSEILGQGGYPKFIYKNSENEISQGYLDSQYYYSKGVDVLCIYFDETKTGKVKFYQPGSNIVTVKFIDSNIEEEVALPISNVTRII